MNTLKQQQTQMLKLSDKATKMSDKNIAELISRVFLLKNRSLDTEVLQFMVSEMQREIREHYYFLSIEEIKAAFDLGVFGHFGVFYEISVVTLCNWIDSYISSEERANLLRKKNEPCKAIEQKSTVTNEDRRKAMQEFIKSRFDEFRKSGKIERFANICYDFLVELGIFNPTKEEKIKAYANSDSLIIKEKKEKHGIQLSNFLVNLSNKKFVQDRKIYYAKKQLAEDFFKVIAENDEYKEIIQ